MPSLTAHSCFIADHTLQVKQASAPSYCCLGSPVGARAWKARPPLSLVPSFWCLRVSLSPGPRECLGPDCCNLSAVNLSFVSKFTWLFLQQHVAPMANLLQAGCWVSLPPRVVEAKVIKQNPNQDRCSASAAHMKRSTLERRLAALSILEMLMRFHYGKAARAC